MFLRSRTMHREISFAGYTHPYTHYRIYCITRRPQTNATIDTTHPIRKKVVIQGLLEENSVHLCNLHYVDNYDSTISPKKRGIEL